MPGPFTRLELLFVHRFAEALFDKFDEMAIPVERIVDNFQTQFALIGGTATRKMRIALLVLNLVLGPDFNFRRIAVRRRRIERWLQFGWFDFVQDLARLKALLYGSYYGHWTGVDQDDNKHNPVHAQIGFTLPKFRDRDAPGEIDISCLPDREIDELHFVRPDDVPDDIDLIVIGSGSGGGVAAYNLAALKHSRRYKVLVIEAGPHVRSTLITHEERRMGALLFKHGTLQTTADRDLIIFQGRNVGGSPTINNGICLKMWGDPIGNPHAPNPYDAWERLGAGIDTCRFDQAYEDVCRHLELGIAEERSGRGNGKHLINGWNRFAAGCNEDWVRSARPDWVLKNYGPPASGRKPDTSCNYCGYCNTGCPYARKLAPAQTYLPQACLEGARILAETKVEKIVWAPGEHPRRAIGVVALCGPARVRRTITAKVGVVVAAGAIASSKLLKRSGIGGTGNGISLNVACPMVALMDGKPAPGETTFNPSWNEDQMTTVVDCGDFLLESHFQPPQSMAMLMPGWFEQMDKRMRAYSQIRSAGVLVPLDRNGRLRCGELDVKFKQADMKLLRRALGVLAKVHFAAGAVELWPALRTGAPLLRPAEGKEDATIERFFKSEVREPDDLTLSSAHPHGGNPINRDPAKGVVDPDCRLHGASNVLVTDASVFPSSIRVNAHFSTMAVAQYATGYGDPFACGASASDRSTPPTCLRMPGTHASSFEPLRGLPIAGLTRSPEPP